MKSFEEIFAEWHDEFPFLKKYSPSTLYQKVGPFLMGLRIGKIGEESYRIFLEMIPLWYTERRTFGQPCVYDELDDKKGGQEIISYRHHDLDFSEALKDAKRQYGLVLTPEIPLNDLIEYLELESERGAYGSKYVRQLSRCSMFETQLAIATYLNKKELFDDTWKHIMTESPKWDTEYFNQITGRTVEERIENMHSKFASRDKFMDTVEWNYQRPRVARLNTGHIIRVDEYTEYIPKLSWREKIRSIFTKR